MKYLLPLFLLVLGLASYIHAADDKLIAAVRAADDERVAATRAGDRKRLNAIYSDELHYAHSSGKVDNKASQIEGIVTSESSYDKIEYPERKFVAAAPGIVLMKGRALFYHTNKKTGAKIINDLNYLAVWRNENGKWRFLAWQSCKNPPAEPARK